MVEAYMHVIWDHLNAVQIPWWVWVAMVAFIIGINCGEGAQ